MMPLAAAPFLDVEMRRFTRNASGKKQTVRNVPTLGSQLLCGSLSLERKQKSAVGFAVLSFGAAAPKGG